MPATRLAPGLAFRRRAAPLVKLMLAAMAAGAGGCASKVRGPEVLSVAPEQYAAAFDAAAEAARRAGMPAALRDRRSGVIETEPRVAGSILEPWRIDNASLGQAFENTFAYQRRRARFEFMPADMPPPAEPTGAAPLTGPDLVGAEQPLDLSQASGPLELRVWVYVEQASIPGIRRSTWTRSKTSQAQLAYPEGVRERPRGMVVTWTPIARDPDYEQRLLGTVQELLARGETETEVDESPTTRSEPETGAGE